MGNIIYPEDFLASSLRSGEDYEITINLGRSIHEALFRNKISLLNTQFVTPARIAFTAIYAPDQIILNYAQSSYGMYITQREVIDKVLLVFDNYFPTIDWDLSEGETGREPLIPEELDPEKEKSMIKDVVEKVVLELTEFLKGLARKVGLDPDNPTHLKILAGIIAASVALVVVIIFLVFMRPYVVIASEARK